MKKTGSLAVSTRRRTRIANSGQVFNGQAIAGKPGIACPFLCVTFTTFSGRYRFIAAFGYASDKTRCRADVAHESSRGSSRCFESRCCAPGIDGIMDRDRAASLAVTQHHHDRAVSRLRPRRGRCGNRLMTARCAARNWGAERITAFPICGRSRNSATPMSNSISGPDCSRRRRCPRRS